MAEYKSPPRLYKGHKWGEPDVFVFASVGVVEIVWSTTISSLGRLSVTEVRQNMHGDRALCWRAQIHMHQRSAEFRGRTARGSALNFVRDHIESIMYEIMEFTGVEERDGPVR